MKRVALVVALLLAVGVGAQNAKVIQIDKDDARDAKAKWEALQKAQVDWDAVTERVKKDYLVLSAASKECGTFAFGNSSGGGCYRSGWENNFDFSSDFKFIVPKPQPTYSYSDCSKGFGIMGNNGCIHLTPAIAGFTGTANSIGVIQ